MRNSSSIAVLLIASLLTACAGQRTHRADAAYERMAYAKAVRLYERALQHGADRTSLLKLADACRQQNALADAERHYRRADVTLRLTGDTALHFGQVLMGTGHVVEAEERFYQVLQERPENALAMDLYGSCQGYRSFFADSARYIVSALELPGVVSAFSPVPYRDGILVAGERAASPAKANPWNGRSFLDLYYCGQKTMVSWSAAEPLPGDVNGDFHEGSAVIAPNGRTLYFTRSNYAERKLGKDASGTSHLKLFRSTLDSLGRWGDIRSFAHNGEAFSTGHPALSVDGRTLYFASDRPGGLGGTDLWRCQDNGTGWSEPENLGPTVNSPGNELFPVINGDVLHFSSTGHVNMGGLDIFETQEVNGQWSDPTNLGYPVNSMHDDMGFVVDQRPSALGTEGTHGYFSSDRAGIDQVFTFWAAEPMFSLEGDVSTEGQAPLPFAEVTLTEMLNAEDTGMITGPDGRFKFALKPNTDYVVRVKREGMITTSQPISTRGITSSDPITTRFALVPIALDRPMPVSDIHYDYGKWEIRPDAARELDKLARLFKDNPQLNFELDAHTDSRGGDMYNLVLSDARAQSAENYLIQQGVNPDRISSKGFGETVLVNRCANNVPCTEEEHQVNRRTEFKVVGIDTAQQP